MIREQYKYVVVSEYGEWPILFPVVISHATIPKHRAISAGFCAFKKDGKGGRIWEAYGESDSLHLQSRPVEDSKLLNLYFAE